MTRKRFYVGHSRKGADEVFKCEGAPTEYRYGHLYFAVTGPFRTKRGASFMARYGRGNPHCQTVSDAERIAKHAAQSGGGGRNEHD